MVEQILKSSTNVFYQDLLGLQTYAVSQTKKVFPDKKVLAFSEKKVFAKIVMSQIKVGLRLDLIWIIWQGDFGT